MSQPNFRRKGFIPQLHIMAAPTFKGASAAGCQNLLQHAIHIIIPMVCIPKNEVFERSVGLCSRTRRLNPLSLSQLHPHLPTFNNPYFVVKFFFPLLRFSNNVHISVYSYIIHPHTYVYFVDSSFHVLFVYVSHNPDASNFLHIISEARRLLEFFLRDL